MKNIYLQDYFQEKIFAQTKKYLRKKFMRVKYRDLLWVMGHVWNINSEKKKLFTAKILVCANVQILDLTSYPVYIILNNVKTNNFKNDANLTQMWKFITEIIIMIMATGDKKIMFHENFGKKGGLCLVFIYLFVIRIIRDT